VSDVGSGSSLPLRTHVEDRVEVVRDLNAILNARQRLTGHIIKSTKLGPLSFDGDAASMRGS
jgi:hypothetical protein